MLPLKVTCILLSLIVFTNAIDIFTDPNNENTTNETEHDDDEGHTELPGEEKESFNPAIDHMIVKNKITKVIETLKKTKALGMKFIEHAASEHPDLNVIPTFQGILNEVSSHILKLNGKLTALTFVTHSGKCAESKCKVYNEMSAEIDDVISKARKNVIDPFKRLVDLVEKSQVDELSEVKKQLVKDAPNICGDELRENIKKDLNTLIGAASKCGDSEKEKENTIKEELEKEEKELDKVEEENKKIKEEVEEKTEEAEEEEKEEEEAEELTTEAEEVVEKTTESPEEVEEKVSEVMEKVDEVVEETKENAKCPEES